MSKKLTSKQRVHAGFILAMAFLLVLASNRLNQRNFSNLEQTVDSIFEDRVVAQGYIYRLNNLFHIKEMSLSAIQRKNTVVTNNAAIEELLESFSKTRLTRDESVHFNRLTDNHTQLKALENALVADQGVLGRESNKEQLTLLKKIGGNLDGLSGVQLSEGRLMTEISKKSLNINQLLSQLEVAFLIVIAVLFLLIIFHGEKPDRLWVEENGWGKL
ncbi:MCP four helix bundle domain-containing protein [Pricia sp.]|uniref:MCP four helix bundle domain-containing protein n=1 Tax=Pricia sp. TaxID=2268138 RepID=UPI003593485C